MTKRLAIFGLGELVGPEQRMMHGHLPCRRRGTAVRLSLGKKIVFVLVAFAALLTAVAIFASGRAINELNERHYLSKADELAATVARAVDAESARTLRDQMLEVYAASQSKVGSDKWGSPEFNAYTSQFSSLEKTKAYQDLLAGLRRLQEVNSVECLYLIYVEPHDRVCIYLVDAALVDPCPIGCFDPLFEFNAQVLTDPKRGFPAYITNTEEYGWLVTAAAPALDAQGEVVCFACTDISMDSIKTQQNEFVVRLAAIMIVVTVLLSLLVIWLARRSVIQPINQLAKSAARYGAREGNENMAFDNLEIHTGDEIESLHKSMVKMGHDVETHIDNLVKTRAELSSTQREAERMNELANKDALTGIRNKMAYDQEVVRLDAALREGATSFGIAMVDLNDLKLINDNYGHDCGNESLRRLCSVVCHVFTHSPVFRVGGDEFVVILRNNDYDKIEELAEEFRQVLERLQADGSLHPWERISAALGYALFDPQRDRDVDDVFRRADHNMYQEKKRMKAGR